MLVMAITSKFSLSTRWTRPPRAWALSEWALLPLRLTLGVTFIYAALNKLANPDFTNFASPNSIQQQLLGSIRTHTPLAPLLGHAMDAAPLLGWTIAIGELAIGIGTLIGLWGRVAAVGGAALSFGLFLTVSWHASPFFTGADLAYFFAWLPLIIAGSGTALSVDAWVGERAAQREVSDPPTLVSIPFADVQRLCGNFSQGKCSALDNGACSSGACPVLMGSRRPLDVRRKVDHVDRRNVIVGGAVALGVAGVSAVAAGATATIGGALAGKSSTTTPVTINSGGSSGKTFSLGLASNLAVGASATFNIPSSDEPGIVIHNPDGTFVAYNAICPHAGCPVSYLASSQIIACPCHGSQFQPSNGDLIGGPSPTGLTALTVTQNAAGELEVTA